ncbi:hypothetical protein JL722_1899 [Aureococcus anophagefferens]|nr:hypothetical protein JL722_1899 [Aureococcus anophagefferens]
MDPASEPIRQATVCSRSGALLREGASLESGVVGKAIHGQKCLVGELHETTSKGHVVLRRRVLSPVEGFVSEKLLKFSPAGARKARGRHDAPPDVGRGAALSDGYESRLREIAHRKRREALVDLERKREHAVAAVRAQERALQDLWLRGARTPRARRARAPRPPDSAPAARGAAPLRTLTPTAERARRSKSLPPGRPSTPARPAEGPVSAWRRDRERTNGHGDVRALDDATFDRCVADDATWMVNFYASWCVYCTRLAPAWRELAAAAGPAAARGGAVRVGAVDVMANPKLAKRFGIRGFPTIVLFRGGSMYAAAPKYEYVGVRSPESLVAFAWGGFEDLAKPLPVPPPDDEPEQRTPPKAPKPSPKKKSPKKRADAREPEPEPEPEAAAAAVEPRSPQPAAPRRRGARGAVEVVGREPAAEAPGRGAGFAARWPRRGRAGGRAPCDGHARRAPPREDTRTLVAHLVEPFGDDGRRAVFAWVADNVAHETPALLEEEHPEAVLRRGTADALGYANVLKHLLDVAGIPSMALRGLCKDAPAATLAAPARHAWSAVQLDGDWRLCDACLGAGVQRGGSWAKRFDAYWWSVDPDKFLASHLPDAPLRHWQLVPRPLVDRAAWEDLPRVHHAAADAHGVALAAPLAARVAHGAPTPFRASFDCPPAVALIASLRKRGGARTNLARRVFAQRDPEDGARAVVDATFPEPGAYSLRVACRRRGTYGACAPVASFEIDVAASGCARGDLPRAHAAWLDAACVLAAPAAGAVDAGGALAVGVRAPGRRRVDVRATLAGDAWGHFVGDVRLDRADKGARSSSTRFGTADLEPLVSFDVA